MKKRRNLKKKIIITTLIVLICIIIGWLASMPYMIINPMIDKHFDVETIPLSDFGVEATPIKLKTDDGLAIASWIVDKENPKGIVILLSGMQNPSVTEFGGYAKMLKENGYATMLIEMRGHGESEGNGIALGMKEWLDVKAGVKSIKGMEKYKNTPIIVWGTSMGGATAVNSIGEIPEIDGVISFSAFSSFTDVFGDFTMMNGAPEFFADLERPFTNLYLGFRFGFDKLKICPINEIKKLDGRPALLMHSTEDTQVPFDNFTRITKKAGDTVNTYTRNGDEHFIYYEKYYKNPAEDKEISDIVLKFLNDNFK